MKSSAAEDSNIREIREKVYSGTRLSDEEALDLFRSNDLLSIGELADYVNRRKNGEKVYFVVNRHINPTNICINKCQLCAFGRDESDSDAYLMSMAEVMSVAGAAASDGATEVHIVGGLHPTLPFEFYLEIINRIKNEFPGLHIQAFTAVEIDYFSRISRRSIKDVFRALVDSGLGSLPGGGAEIFNSGVRNDICSKKISGERWLEIMETAHNSGLRSNATMLYGHIETLEDRIQHMSLLRDLQDRTGGFQSFIPLAFHPENTRINKKGLTTGVEDLKTLALARVYLDNFKHIKAFWIMLGEKLSQISLNFGVNDLDGTVVEERITHSAGAQTGEFLPRNELIRFIQSAGRIPVERDTLYNELKIYS